MGSRNWNEIEALPVLQAAVEMEWAPALLGDVHGTLRILGILFAVLLSSGEIEASVPADLIFILLV